MVEFIATQIPLMTRVQGAKVLVEAGRFHWFLVRLLQRQESMKARLEANDPLISELDPKLRKRIKAGWNAVDFPAKHHTLVDRLEQKLQAGRAQSHSTKRP